MFLHGSSTPQASWTVIGVGIRLAQDVGAHRKKVYNPARTVEEELWKRAVWSALFLRRWVFYTHILTDSAGSWLLWTGLLVPRLAGRAPCTTRSECNIMLFCDRVPLT